VSSDGSERVRVSTYVPAHQKETWATDAEALQMSQSEFVRTMVQIGRRDFDVPSLVENGQLTGTGDETERTGDADERDAVAEPEGADSGETATRGFEDRVVDALSADDYRDWDELLETLSAGLEDRLDEALADLQEANRVRYSGRHGGYTLVESSR
jgi:hypothetical protein